MTATTPGRTDPQPAAPRERDARIADLVALVGAAFASRAAGHDRDDRVVAKNLRVCHASSSVRFTVHTDLDGLGATLRQIGHIQAALARSGAATVPTSATPRLISLVTADPRRRVADIELVLSTSGGTARS